MPASSENTAFFTSSSFWTGFQPITTGMAKTDSSFSSSLQTIFALGITWLHRDYVIARNFGCQDYKIVEAYCGPPKLAVDFSPQWYFFVSVLNCVKTGQNFQNEWSVERSVFADVAESYLGPGENTRISSYGTKTTNSVVEGLKWASYHCSSHCCLRKILTQSKAGFPITQW